MLGAPKTIVMLFIILFSLSASGLVITTCKIRESILNLRTSTEARAVGRTRFRRTLSFRRRQCQDYFFGFTFFTADSVKGRRMKEELRSASRGFCSLQDGNENRGQLFALLSQRRELFHADNPRFHEQFQPVGAFFNLAQRIAAFRDELIRSSPTRFPLPSRLYRLCR